MTNVDIQPGQPMTSAQREYLELLAEEAGEPFDSGLDQAEAARLIEELRERTGRGVHERDPHEPVPTPDSPGTPN